MAVSIPKSNSKNPVLTGKLLKMIEKTTENICFEATYTNGDSRLYYGDNLDVLNVLCNDDAICGQVNLIYIDPPYSTGGIFQTRDQKNAYTDTLIGNDYLEFMQKRLVLLHKLLHEQGSIYVHLDSKMVFHIKIMLDNIFGEHNFQGMITRKKCKPKNYTKKNLWKHIRLYFILYKN